VQNYISEVEGGAFLNSEQCFASKEDFSGLLKEH
jgi:hypothetical protein